MQALSIKFGTTVKSNIFPFSFFAHSPSPVIYRVIGLLLFISTIPLAANGQISIWFLEQHVAYDTLEEKNHVTRIFLSGDHARMEMEDRILIFDFNDTLILELIPKKKIFSVYPIEELYPNQDLPKVGVRHTGEKKEINGYLAEQVFIDFNNDQGEAVSAEIWMTRETDIPLSYFMQFSQFDPVFQTIYKPLIMKNGFPIYQVIRINGRIVTTSFKDIKEVPLKNNLFLPPEDWKKVEH